MHISGASYNLNVFHISSVSVSRHPALFSFLMRHWDFLSAGPGLITARFGSLWPLRILFEEVVWINNLGVPAALWRFSVLNLISFMLFWCSSQSCSPVCASQLVGCFYEIPALSGLELLHQTSPDVCWLLSFCFHRWSTTCSKFPLPFLWILSM